MKLSTSACLLLLIGLLTSTLCSRNANAQVPQTSNQQYIPSLGDFEEGVWAGSRNVVRTNPGVGEGVVGITLQDGSLAYTAYDGPRSVVGIDVQSAAGLLTTAEDAGDFGLVLANDSTRVTVGILGEANRLNVNGRTGLSFGYTGQNPSTDLVATWGRDTEAIPFPIVGPGEVGYTPFNLDNDGNIFADYSPTFSALVEAGSASGTPPDSPANRVDPNDATARFSGVGSLEIVHPSLGTFICTASVISDDKLLTAAHCFDQDNDGAVDPGILTNSQFFLNDGGSPSATRGLMNVEIDPDFDGFAANGGHDDFAVVMLDSAVPAGTTKYAIRNTGLAASEVVEFVGYGISGFGDVPGIEVLPDFSVKRSGQNTADLFIVDDEGSGMPEVFVYDFDDPNGGVGFLGGETLGNDVEGSIRGGDSGGPAFVDVNGVQAIAGVMSFELVLDGITADTGEFGVLGGGPVIDEETWNFIQLHAPEATLVPEPGGFTLSGLALIGVALLRRRRNR